MRPERNRSCLSEALLQQWSQLLLSTGVRHNQCIEWTPQLLCDGCRRPNAYKAHSVTVSQHTDDWESVDADTSAPIYHPPTTPATRASAIGSVVSSISSSVRDFLQ